MLQPDLNLQVRLLSDALKLPPVAGDRVSSVTRLVPGQAVMARIQEQLPDGRFKVQVAGNSLSMQLPAETQVGQSVRMVYVGPEPRLSFALLETPGRESYTTNMSSAGRLVSSLVLGTQANPLQTADAAPVLASMPMAGVEIESSLRQTLSQSGLFYESHQAQWVAGDHSLEQLLKEPQGRLSPQLASHTAMLARGSHDIAQMTMSVIASQDEAATAASQLPKAQEIPSHPATLPIIQHQLSVLETGHIFWQGQIWPGQTMDWKVYEQPQGGGPDQQQSSWDSRLSLDMAMLGPVDARLHIQQGKVAIILQADNEDAIDLMQQHGPELIHALESKGLPVSAFSVTSHGD
ncbi:MAG: flagellar hook-length control protein FliK [Georgfuchsia sp.]